jgi:hypothetical protein
VKAIEVIPVGASSIGTVVVMHFVGTPNEEGKPTEHRYEVRVGNAPHIVKPTKKAAMALAEALCD